MNPRAVFGLALLTVGVGIATSTQTRQNALMPPPAPLPPSTLPTWRSQMLGHAESLLGTLYQWGGGHGPNDWGLDCSGLVIVSMKAAGVPLPTDTNTSGVWWKTLPKVTTPEPGDLAFYGSNGKAHHVVFVTDYAGNQGIGAVGDKPDVTPEIAKAAGHMVKHVHLASPILLGFASVDPARRGLPALG